MTDSDIIKALECCSNAEPCENCPYQKQCDETDLAEIALDLINRQKAEIDCLQKELHKKMYDFETEYDSKIKAEAIKEFAERLKKARNSHNAIWDSDIDNLVKEMVGE